MQEPEELQEPWSLYGFIFGWRSERIKMLRARVEELEAKVVALESTCELLAEVAEHSRRWLEASTQSAIHASTTLGLRPEKKREG